MLKSRIGASVSALIVASMSTLPGWAICLPQKHPEPENVRQIGLIVPSKKPNEKLWLRVTVGPLKMGEEVAIMDEQGATIGSVFPFGDKARNTGTVQWMGLPPVIGKDQCLNLLAQLIADDGLTTRAPTEGELISIEVATQ